MEEHFILRLKDEIKDIVKLEESKLERIDDKRVNLIHNNITYPGIIVRLPCIIESQKTLDKKQYYKISDISTLIVIYPHSDYDFEQERRLLEISGLTPPLKYTKTRRFRKNMTSKAQMLSEIEKKVYELLEKDKSALSVEYNINKKIVDEGEIDNLAAEIENNFELETASENEILTEESEEIKELRKEIKQQEDLVNNALNPILKQRFAQKLEILKNKLKELQK